MTTEEKAIPAKFMRPRRYAERVSINWRTCYHYIDQGLFPAYKFQGVVLLDVEECDAILKALVRRVAPRFARSKKTGVTREQLKHSRQAKERKAVAAV